LTSRAFNQDTARAKRPVRGRARTVLGFATAMSCADLVLADQPGVWDPGLRGAIDELVIDDPPAGVTMGWNPIHDPATGDLINSVPVVLVDPSFWVENPDAVAVCQFPFGGGYAFRTASSYGLQIHVITDDEPEWFIPTLRQVVEGRQMWGGTSAGGTDIFLIPNHETCAKAPDLP